MGTVFCVKLVTDELPHYLGATDVREDWYGDMEVLLGDEVIAWYSQPIVEWWALEEASVFADPNWRTQTSSWGDELREMISRGTPAGVDDAGGLWYDITPSQGR